MKITSIAPGRVCLFGDHQDYLGLPVIACAVDRQIKLEAKPNNKNLFRIDLPDIDSHYQIDINDPVIELKKRDYFASGLRTVQKHGIFPERGFDIQIYGNIPINSGLSSSSAIVVAWINFLISAANVKDVDQSKVALMAYEAEVTEHGESGGMMDHYAIALGNIQNIYQENEFLHKQTGTSLNTLIIGESGVSKDTVGLLKEKKENALKVVEILRNEDLCFKLNDVSSETYHKYVKALPKDLIPYFYAAVHNHLITKEALNEFSQQETNLKKIGLLMSEHHKILRDKLKITVPLIDDMIDAALNSGACGAKIVGSGGGGSIVALTEESVKQRVIESILKTGAKDAFEVKVAKGAEILI